MILDTPCGKICAESCDDQSYTAFKGIRYARAERWKLPKQVTHWDGVYDARQFKDCCFQPRAFCNEEKDPEKAFWFNEFRKGQQFTYSEDCLNLNIYVPGHTIKPEASYPVVFFVHGGSFLGGCAHEKPFSGQSLCRKGIILVTVQYRLGIFGFFSSPELRQDGQSGNFALYDLLTALKWVRDNISSFGGDENNISLMGQSAGAMAMTLLALSPLAKGLYSKAILLSGGGVLPETTDSYSNVKLEEFYMQSPIFRKPLQELCVLDPQTLTVELQRLMHENKTGTGMQPVIDSAILPELPSVLLGKLKKGIPTMIGSTQNDIAAETFHALSHNWAQQQSRLGAPSYCYIFSRMLPGDQSGAFHSSDLWYFFGSLAHCWRPFNQWDYQLSSTMTAYLANFAYTGNPNIGPHCTELPAFWEQAVPEQDRFMSFGNSAIHMDSI